MKKQNYLIKFAIIIITCSFLIAHPASAATKKNNLKEVNIPNNLLQLFEKNPHCEFLNKLIQNYDVFLDIYKNCNSQFWQGCGSYLFDGITYDYCELMYEKQKLLFETAKKSTRLLEIGVYMGHSIFISLLANPNLEITCIDIEDYLSKPALEIIAKKFNNKINFIKGDSLIVLPSIYDKFDMFHIDGSHSADYINSEFTQCLNKYLDKKVFFIIDDYDYYPDTVSKLLLPNDKYKVLNFTLPNSSWRNIMIEVLLN